MNISPHNLSLLFYPRYHEEGHDLARSVAGRIGTFHVEAGVSSLRMEDADAGERRFLIVDDGPDGLGAYTQLLQTIRPSWRVLHAPDARRAQSMLGRIRPSLVLLDPMLPDIDGFSLLDAMQSDEQLRSVPVVVVTAQLLTQEDVARLSDRVAAILIKGLFTVEETSAHISQALAVSKKAGRASRRMVHYVMASIHEHYAEPLTRDSLAGIAAVSSRHLTRCFTAEAGIPPMTYLNRCRIREAMRLLQRDTKSIAEIARTVGFSNNAYFDVVFRREVGLAPGDYRRRHQAWRPGKK